MSPLRSRILVFVGLQLLLLAPFAFPTENQAPVFSAQTADGIALTGRLRSLLPDGTLVIDGKETRTLSGTDLITLRRPDLPLPLSPTGAHVRLTNGDRIPGRLLKLSGERLRLAADLGRPNELSLPLSSATVVWLAPPAGPEASSVRQRRQASERRSQDRVLLLNGDIVEGTWESFDGKQLRFEGKDVGIAAEQIRAVALNSDLARQLKPRGSYYHLVLKNGARIGLRDAQSDGKVLSAKTLSGESIEIPLADVVALDARQNRAVYLSDLKPLRYEHTAYLGVRWPYVFDASVVGGDLKLVGNTHDKGIGMHSESRLTFDLAGAYSWFESTVGLDEESGREGSARVEVMVDGKPQNLGWDQDIVGGESPHSIRIPVAKAKELTLAVRYGRRGDVQDHVDWVDARLIK